MVFAYGLQENGRYTTHVGMGRMRCTQTTDVHRSGDFNIGSFWWNYLYQWIRTFGLFLYSSKVIIIPPCTLVIIMCARIKLKFCFLSFFAYYSAPSINDQHSTKPLILVPHHSCDTAPTMLYPAPVIYHGT